MTGVLNLSGEFGLFEGHWEPLKGWGRAVAWRPRFGSLFLVAVGCVVAGLGERASS